MNLPLIRCVTNSEVQSYACPNRHHLRYVEGRTSGNARTPLRQGSLWDRCLGTWYRDNGKSTVEQIRIGVIEPWLEERRAYTDTQEDGDYLADEDREVAELTVGMLSHYAGHYWQDFEAWEFVHVNPQMARWLVHPHTGGEMTSMVDIAGVQTPVRWARGGEADTIVRSKEDGSWWIWENKATDAQNWQKTMNDFAFSSQCIGYAWACGDPIDHPDCDIRQPIKIAGTVYNVARKHIPSEPKKLDGGGLSKDKRIDTTVEVYRAAIAREGLNAAAYGDILGKIAEKPAHFARHMPKYTEDQVEAFGFEAAHSALEILQEAEKDHHVRRDSLCTGPMSFGCQFRSICKDASAESLAKFNVRDIRHDELRGVLSEPWVATVRNRS